ncbi:unnamed protein product [Lota lota]
MTPGRSSSRRGPEYTVIPTSSSTREGRQDTACSLGMRTGNPVWASLESAQSLGAPEQRSHAERRAAPRDRTGAPGGPRWLFCPPLPRVVTYGAVGSVDPAQTGRSVSCDERVAAEGGDGNDDVGVVDFHVFLLAKDSRLVLQQSWTGLATKGGRSEAKWHYKGTEKGKKKARARRKLEDGRLFSSHWWRRPQDNAEQQSGELSWKQESVLALRPGTNLLCSLQEDPYTAGNTTVVS